MAGMTMMRVDGRGGALGKSAILLRSVRRRESSRRRSSWPLLPRFRFMAARWFAARKFPPICSGRRGNVTRIRRASNGLNSAAYRRRVRLSARGRELASGAA